MLIKLNDDVGVGLDVRPRGQRHHMPRKLSHVRPQYSGLDAARRHTSSIRRLRPTACAARVSVRGSPARSPGRAARRAGAAGFHGFGKVRFGAALLTHQRIKLTRDHALDGACGHGLVRRLVASGSHPNDDPICGFFFFFM
jgi:hypothetical protein